MKIKPLWIASLGMVFGLVVLPQALSQSNREVVQNPVPASASNVETLKLTSQVFGNTRTIRVLLPPGYHDAQSRQKRYPVLYLTDGTMVFKPDRLNIEGVVHELIRRGEIPPIIVVGIDNGGATDKTKNPGTDRANEFLPYPDVGFPPNHLYAPDPPNPQGKLFPDFLIGEVMPRIKQHYRVKPGMSNTGLGGFSYGGVAALYTAMREPGVFGKILLESTPLWIGAEKQLLQETRKTTLWPATVYIGVGTKEAPDEAINNEGKQDVAVLSDAIRTQSPKTALKVVLEEGAKHEPSAWRGRLPGALRHLFNR